MTVINNNPKDMLTELIQLRGTNVELRGLVNVLAYRLAEYTGGTEPGEIEKAEQFIDDNPDF